jgi:hypothetical protein
MNPSQTLREGLTQKAQKIKCLMAPKEINLWSVY